MEQTLFDNAPACIVGGQIAGCASEIVLTKGCGEAALKAYFTKVHELYAEGKEFPISLDNVWPLVYGRKSDAVESLRRDFMESVDYQILRQNPQNSKGGRPTEIYHLTVSCMEFFIARKVREVFDVYRQVFHRSVDALQQAKFNLPQTFSEALRMLADKVEKNEQLMLENQKMKPKADYYDGVLQKQDTFTMTDVADELGMSVHKLTKELVYHEIIYKPPYGRYLLRVPYKNWRLHETRTPQDEHAKPYTVWNNRGRMFLHKLKENGWNARKAVRSINPSFEFD